jgi:hypothetical protein
MNSYHKADTAEQKTIRDETVAIYMNLFRSQKELSRADMLVQIKAYQSFIIAMMTGVQDNTYDDVQWKGYTNTKQEYIANAIGMAASIGLNTVMPIGEHIIKDFERMVKAYS